MKLILLTVTILGLTAAMIPAYANSTIAGDAAATRSQQTSGSFAN